jgi:flagellar hook assembly protein FlgD
MRLVAFVSYYNSDTTKRNILNANVVKLGQSTATGIDENSINVVDVKQNTPNPFKDITAIQFQLNTADNISVKIYNMMGQEINTLVNTQLVPGLHTFYWAGDDNTGNYVRPGIYFYKISTPSQSVSKEMIYMGKQ